MPVTQNPKECGWFYHAPSKKNIAAERMEYPAPSQIPGIGYDDPSAHEPQQTPEMMFKDSDSKYIRLAKIGGRKDLLQFNPELNGGKKSQDAVGYHRNDWFYLEDNRAEDSEKKEEEKKAWDFLLPEYMVHKGYNPSFEDPATPPSRGKNAPYHTDNRMTETEYEEREGRSATDKLRVKLPEHRKPGYGIRNEKPPIAMQKPPPREQPRRVRRNGNMQPENDNPTSMSSLMSGQYERDWHDKLNCLTLEEKHSQSQKAGPDYIDVNKERFSKTTTPQRQGRDEKENEMFKLSRFQNIPSKIDSHQRKEIMAAVK